MVTFTISLPAVLKDKMDAHPKENWSKVCREAIDVYIRMLENPIPDIKLELREIRFGYAKGIKPGLWLDLSFRNEVNMQLMLDRVLFEVDFRPMPAETLSVGLSVDMRKHIIPLGKWVMTPFIEVDPDVILSLDERLSRSFQCAAHITVFFEGFKEAYTTSLAVKIPIDEWRRFVEWVVKNEKEKMEIKKKRLSEITEKLG